MVDGFGPFAPAKEQASWTRAPVQLPCKVRMRGDFRLEGGQSDLLPYSLARTCYAEKAYDPLFKASRVDCLFLFFTLGCRP